MTQATSVMVMGISGMLADSTTRMRPYTAATMKHNKPRREVCGICHYIIAKVGGRSWYAPHNSLRNFGKTTRGGKMGNVDGRGTANVCHTGPCPTSVIIFSGTHPQNKHDVPGYQVTPPLILAMKKTAWASRNSLEAASRRLFSASQSALPSAREEPGSFYSRRNEKPTRRPSRPNIRNDCEYISSVIF